MFWIGMGYGAAFHRRYVRPVAIDLHPMVISDEEKWDLGPSHCALEIAFEAMRTNLNVCLIARKSSRFIEGPHDAPGQLSRRRQFDIHGPLVRSVEPIVTEPDHHDGPVVEQPVEIPPLKIIRRYWRAPPIFPDLDLFSDAEGFEVVRSRRQVKLCVVGN